MAATDKAGLLDITGLEWLKLAALIDRIEDDVALAKDADDTSIKDVIAHRAHWIDLFLGWYRDGQAGKDVAFPAPGYKWNELDRYNADLRAAQSGLDWPGAQAMLVDRKVALVNFINGLDDSALYGGPMKGARNAWPPGRWAEAAGASHFRSAAKYIRARLKAGR